MKKLSGVVIGALLIACGTVYALSVFGFVDVNVSLDGWWAFFIIIPCLNGVITSKDKLGNLAGLAVGVLLLLAAQGLFGYAVVWKAVVPLIIIMLGIKIILKSVSGSNNNAKPFGETQECMAAFTSKNVDYKDKELKAAKIGAVFGGAKCNLSDAKITDGSQIDVFCLFGGADIIVPENVSVKINAFCLFGGISDKRVLKEVSDGNTVLNINGFCMFGGADIK